MIPMDVFALILAALAGLGLLLPARRDWHRTHITPAEWWNNIHRKATTRPAGWWICAASTVFALLKFALWLAAGLGLAALMLFGAALVLFGEGAKAMADIAIAIAIGAAWLLWHADFLAKPPHPRHSGLTELVPAHQGDPS
uniref:hypothetical protein n=1 Tax=Streptosporangium sp. CA-235898 TaxID=3240073 RepID=UPI003F497701